jgi:hypothetical protein
MNGYIRQAGSPALRQAGCLPLQGSKTGAARIVALVRVLTEAFGAQERGKRVGFNYNIIKL